jgi:hypothetical protein
MVERPKCGTSINNLLLSEPDITINLGTLRAQVRPTTCKSGALTLVGGKSSSMRTANLSTGTTTRFLMLEELRMKKVNKLEFMVTTMVNTKNGPLSILIKLKAHKPREYQKTLDSILTDHSTLSQSFHSEELQNAMVLTMSG